MGWSMKLGNILIMIFTIISIVGFGYMFGMGLFYLEHSSHYGLIGIITIISAVIDFGLLAIKKEN